MDQSGPSIDQIGQLWIELKVSWTIGQNRQSKWVDSKTVENQTIKENIFSRTLLA